MRTLTPEQQWFRLRSSSISRGRGRVHRGKLLWEFGARPTALGRIYDMRLTYERGDFPKVCAQNPDLNALADGRFLPHVYSARPVQLCVYHPKYLEWAPTQSFTETIVPWTYLWLAYYEDWLVTDEWKGGGKHPGEIDEPHTQNPVD